MNKTFNNQRVFETLEDRDWKYSSNFSIIPNELIPRISTATDNGNAALVYLFIITQKPMDKPYNISTKYISQRLGMSLNTVRAAFNLLFDKGILRYIPDEDGNPTLHFSAALDEKSFNEEGPKSFEEAFERDRNTIRLKKENERRISAQDERETAKLANTYSQGYVERRAAEAKSQLKNDKEEEDIFKHEDVES